MGSAFSHARREPREQPLAPTMGTHSPGVREQQQERAPLLTLPAPEQIRSLQLQPAKGTPLLRALWNHGSGRRTALRPR